MDYSTFIQLVERQAIQRPKPNGGFIYFFLHPHGYVKIGHTFNVDYRDRLNQIQGANPYEIRPIFVFAIGNARNVERLVHRYLSDAWVRGEWFEHEHPRTKEAISVLKGFSGRCTDSFPSLVRQKTKSSYN